MKCDMLFLVFFLISSQAVCMEQIVLEYDLCLPKTEDSMIPERFREMRESVAIGCDSELMQQDFSYEVDSECKEPGIRRERKKNIELSLAVRSNDLVRVQSLLTNDYTDPNEPVYGAMTPLMRAVDEGFYEIVEVLLRAGASPNLVPRHHLTQCTALHYAVNHNNFAMVKLLLKYGARDLQKDRFDETPLGLARRLNLKEIVDFFYGVS